MFPLTLKITDGMLSWHFSARTSLLSHGVEDPVEGDWISVRYRKKLKDEYRKKFLDQVIEFRGQDQILHLAYSGDIHKQIRLPARG